MHRCYRKEEKKEESGLKIAIPLDENKKDVCVHLPERLIL